MMHWDFEKYASVILYINSYYEKYMASRNGQGLLDFEDEVKLGIPVTDKLLAELDMEETLDEFCNEAQIMTDEMNLDPDNPLLVIEREGEEATLYIDTFILAIFTEQDEYIEDNG